MKVIVTIRQAETRRLEGQRPDYAAARDDARAQVPEGWEILAYRVER
jgi:hypothetical protein